MSTAIGPAGPTGTALFAGTGSFGVTTGPTGTASFAGTGSFGVPPGPTGAASFAGASSFGVTGATSLAGIGSLITGPTGAALSEARAEIAGALLKELAHEVAERDDEADGVVDDTVPELGLKLLPFLLPRKLRDNVVGDLAQDFQDYVAKFGRTYAVRWYWWELGRLCVSRLGPTAIVAAIAFWLRRKIGF